MMADYEIDPTTRGLIGGLGIFLLAMVGAGVLVPLMGAGAFFVIWPVLLVAGLLVIW